MTAGSTFLLILLCLSVGAGLRRVRAFPANTPHVLNSIVIYVSFPALVLAQVPGFLANLRPNGDLLFPVVMAWLVFAGSLALFSQLGKRLGWSAKVTGALILTAGLGNTSFVGFPMVEALYGANALHLAIVVDQAGSFLVLSLLGFLVASIYAENRLSFAQLITRTLRFPPFIALLGSGFLALVGLQIPSLLQPVFERLGATLAPLALLSVGFQLRINGAAFRERRVPLTLGLLYKLALAPLVLLMCAMGLGDSLSLTTQVTILEAAMAPMITAAIVAQEFDLDSELANLMVGIGIPLSLITVPLWWKFALSN